MSLEQTLLQFIKNEKLPLEYTDIAKQWYVPLFTRIAKKVQLHQLSAKTPFFVGVNGAQGSGKSTLSALLLDVLNNLYEYNTICMSLDDFYLTKDERITLAKNIHPLLATRGVPGTHDIDFLSAVFDKLKNDESVLIPRFDKATDDRASIERWMKVEEHVDVVILEGWCVGSPAQASDALIEPVNALERDQDPTRTWRSYANTQLAQQYQDIFTQLDTLIMLLAPSFEQIYTWRCEQEHKMKQKHASMGKFNVGMSDEDIYKFIQHYQRITQHSLQHLPAQCDEVFTLDNERRVVSCLTR